MGGSQPRILFILADEHETKASAHLGALRNTMAVGSDLRELIDPRFRNLLVVSRHNLAQISRLSLAPFSVIANLVTEPVKNREILNNVRKLLRNTSARILNHPDAVLETTREKVARSLAGIDNFIAPSTVRLDRNTSIDSARQLLERSGITPPIILRRAGTHRGESIVVLDSVEAMSDVLEAEHEHIATQLIDFRSADGLYRKYRVFCIGSQIVLRHMLVSDHWNVHAADRQRFMAPRLELVAEERALLECSDPFRPRVREVLQTVRARMPLDFFGMDFGIVEDGSVVLFEANATMSFFPYSGDPKFDYLPNSFGPAQDAFRELLGLPPAAASPRRLARTA